MPRSTRRTSTTQPPDGKENHDMAQRDNTSTTSSKKARHRLSSAELARLDDAFRQDTHPSRQQKKVLAAELGMSYKTVTIWFQNKRQTSKRGQPPSSPVERLDTHAGRLGTHPDSGLRAVSSPSHNATLDALGHGVDPAADQQGSGLNTIAAKAIVKIKPLIDTLNALTSRSRGRAESAELKGEAPNVCKDVDPRWPQTVSEDAIAVVGSNEHDQTTEQEQIEQTKEKPVRWKRIRTLEWACERQSKRLKLSREAYNRLGSEEVPDHADSSDARMDSALSLLSLASSQVGPPKDVMRGASLLLSFKHSWRRK